MHEMAYLLDQFQQSSQGAWSAQVEAFFAWLNRSLIATWSEKETQPEGVIIPAREADVIWTSPSIDIPGEMRQVAWWQEGKEMVGLLRFPENADEKVLFSFYRFFLTDLSLFRLASWCCDQRPVERFQLTQPLTVRAAAFIPDSQDRNKGQGSALVQIGKDYSVVACQPDRTGEEAFVLDGLPVAFLKRQALREAPPEGLFNDQHCLYFADPLQAWCWFLRTMTLQASGYLLSWSELKAELAAVGAGVRRPGFPNLELMQRYQAELEIDATMPALTEAARQERIAFLVQTTARIMDVAPTTALQALTQDIARLLDRVPGSSQLPASTPENQQ